MPTCRCLRNHAISIALATAVSISVSAQAQEKVGSTDYENGGSSLSPEARAGRDTWYFWTAGNEAFWRRMAILTRGTVDLLMYADSRLHDRRFEALGVINTDR